MQSSGTESAVARAEDAGIVVRVAEAEKDEAKDEMKSSVNKMIVPVAHRDNISYVIS